MALQAAVLRRDLEAVDTLLSNGGVDPHSRDESGWTPLSIAAKTGQREVVELLLAKGVDPDSKCTDRYSKGWTPLSFAASNGHKEVVELLLAKGVDPDSKCTDRDNEGRTPLSFAASNGHKEVVELLLAKGVDPDSKCIDGNNKGRTPLSFAAETGQREVVELLLAKGVDPDSKCIDRYSKGWTPLSFAASNGHKKVVELLLVKGVDPDSKCTDGDNEGQTPLSFAASNGHKEVVELLLAKGVDPDSKCTDGYNKGWTPLSFAASNGHKEVVELLLGKGINLQMRLSAAIKSGPTVLVKFLLQNNYISPHSNDDRGRTLLSIAAETGQREVVELLLTNGVDPDSKCTDRYNKGWTPLSFAASNGHKEVVELLLAKGVDPDSKCTDGYSKGWTPLSFAASNGHKEVVELLLANDNVETNSKDRDGRTPLSWAAAYGRSKVVNLLLAANDIDPDSRDDSGRTPLSLAAEKGHDEIVKRLCQCSSPNIRDKYGRTPLWWAAENKHWRVVKMLVGRDSVTMHMLVQGGKEALVRILLDLGYDIDVCDSSGMTPLRLAIRRKDPSLIELLLKHSARMDGIMVNEWLAAYASQAAHIVQLSEGNNGEKHVHISSTELPPRPADAERRLFVFGDHLHWHRVPLTHSQGQLRPNELQISHQQETSGHGVSFSVSLWFPAEQDRSQAHFSMPEWGEFRIAWTMIPPANPNDEAWKSIDHFSMLPYGWIPSDGVGFFMQFMLYLKERWLRLCELAEAHQTESRLDQLRSEGKSPELMRHLAKDAQKWAELRRILQDQIHTARKFVADYCRYNADRTSNDVQQLDEFEVDITNRISQLDQTVRELLQIELAWAAITESRISTRLGKNVMQLTYVNIFYLPLAYCASVWAIPDISNSNIRNPFIINSLIVGLITLAVAVNLDNIAGLGKNMYHNWRTKLVRDMQSDNRWKERGDKLQESISARKTPSEWWLFGYVLHRIIGTIRKSTKSKPGDGDEEFKPDDNRRL